MNHSIGMRAGLLALCAAGLGGCSFSLSPEPPASLLTLTPATSAPEGAGTRTGIEGTAGAISVMTPEVPAKLNALRVPVAVNETEIAYLTEATWIEKPARLFRRLLGEAIRTRGTLFVLDSDDTPTLADQTLRGTLLDMGYDAASSSVVVRFDAVRTTGVGGVVETRRFEASESGVLAEAGAVGPALNRVANRVAGDVARWVTSESISPDAPPIMEQPSE